MTGFALFRPTPVYKSQAKRSQPGETCVVLADGKNTALALTVQPMDGWRTLSLFYRWQEPAWKRQTIILR